MKNQKFLAVYHSSHSGTSAIQASVDRDDHRIVVSRAVHTEDQISAIDNSGTPLVSFLQDHDLALDLPLVSVLPTSRGYLRYQHSPFTDESNIEKTALYDIEDQIHSDSVENLHIDYSIVGFSSSGSHLQTGAIQKTVLDSFLQNLQNDTLDCISIQFDLISSFQVFKLSDVFEYVPNIWLIHFDGTCISLLYVSNGFPIDARNFIHGTSSKDQQPLTRRLLQELQTTHLSSGLEHFPRNCILTGTPAAPISKQSLEETLKNKHDFTVVDPLNPKKSSTSNPENNQKGAVQEAMKEAVLEANTDSQSFPSSFHLEWNSEQNPERFLPHVGGICSTAFDLPNSIEFRKDEFAYQSLWQAVKRPVLLLSIFLFFSALSLTIVEKHHQNQLLTKKQEYEQTLRTIYRQALPEKNPPPARKIKDTLQKYRKRETETKDLEIPVKKSALDLWLNMFQNLNVRGKIQLTNLSIRIDHSEEGTVNIQGHSADATIPEQLTNQLSNVPQLGSAENYRIEEVNDNGKSQYQFSFSIPILSKNNQK